MGIVFSSEAHSDLTLGTISDYSQRIWMGLHFDKYEVSTEQWPNASVPLATAFSGEVAQ